MSYTAAAAPSSGLVSLGTKDTLLVLDGVSRRVSRMRRGVVSAAKLAQDEMQEGGHRYRAAFVTVTYRPGEKWDAGDIRKLVKHYRQWGQRRGVSLPTIWVGETHTGGGANHGRVHYHLVIFVPRGLTPPMPDKQGWWRKGMSNCKWAYRPVGYLAKYTSKGRCSPRMPTGARLWGRQWSIVKRTRKTNFRYVTNMAAEVLSARGSRQKDRARLVAKLYDGVGVSKLVGIRVVSRRSVHALAGLG